MSVERIRPGGIVAKAAYVPVARAGNAIFISGQVPLDQDGQLVGANDFAVQAERTFANLLAILDAVGLSPRDIAKTTNFLVRREDFSVFNQIRQRFFGEFPPASSTVFVNGLVHPEVLIEVEAIAYQQQARLSRNGT